MLDLGKCDDYLRKRATCPTVVFAIKHGRNRSIFKEKSAVDIEIPTRVWIIKITQPLNLSCSRPSLICKMR